MALTKLNNQSLSAVTAAGIPIRSGSLLNSAELNAPNQVNIGQSTSYSSAWTVNYTPVSSNSVLWFNISCPALAEASNRLDIKLSWRSGTATEILDVMEASGITSPGWHQYLTYVPYKVANNSTSQGTLTCTARSPVSGYAYINYSYAETRIIVNEVAA